MNVHKSVHIILILEMTITTASFISTDRIRISDTATYQRKKFSAINRRVPGK